MSHFVIYRNQNGGPHKIQIFSADQEEQALAVYQSHCTAGESEGVAVSLVSADSLLALAQSTAHERLVASLTEPDEGGKDQ